MHKIEIRFELDISWNFGNVVILVTRLHDGGLVLITGRGKRYLSSPKCTDLLWGPLSLLVLSLV
jgi:hypothetical protein